MSEFTSSLLTAMSAIPDDRYVLNSRLHVVGLGLDAWGYLQGASQSGIAVDTITDISPGEDSPDWGDVEYDTVPRFYPWHAITFIEWYGGPE